MYRNVWLAFIDIQSFEGLKFQDLIDFDDEVPEDYIGAWTNVLVVTDRINEVPDIIEKGLTELNFSLKFIDKIENVASLIEYDEIDENVVEEIDWLLSTEFIFKISDKIFLI